MIKTRLFLFFIVLALSAASSSIYAADRALLIGINQYQNGVTPLRGTVNDVRAVENMLVEGFDFNPSNIKLLLDADATRANILAGFKQWLIDSTSTGDRVFFYFSGHGYYIPDVSGDETGEGKDGLDEVIVPVDTTCDRATGECENFVLDDEIGELLDQLEGRTVFVMIDSCHSGTATRADLLGTANLTGTTRRLTLLEDTSQFNSILGEKRSALSSKVISSHKNEQGFADVSNDQVALFAVSSFQEAPEAIAKDRNGNPITVGFFTHRVVEGLMYSKADSSTDGVVSFGELQSYLRQEGEQFCIDIPRHRACQTGVTPVLEVPVSRMGESILEFGKKPSNISSNQTITSTNGPAVTPDEVSNILANDNQANLVVDILPKSVLNDGDPIVLKINADVDGLLLVLDVNANGELVQLYPNLDGINPNVRPNGKPAGWVKANTDILLPDSYSGVSWPMGEPYGEGALFVVLVEDGEQVESILDATKAFEVVARPTQQLGELRQSLDQLIDLGDVYQSSTQWSIVKLDYVVNP